MFIDRSLNRFPLIPTPKFLSRSMVNLFERDAHYALLGHY